MGGFGSGRTGGKSCTEDKRSLDIRTLHRAGRLRERLGWPRGILNGEGPKPTGMHWQTFERLRAEHNALVHRALGGMAAQLDRNQRTLSNIQRRYQ